MGKRCNMVSHHCPIVIFLTHTLEVSRPWLQRHENRECCTGVVRGPLFAWLVVCGPLLELTLRFQALVDFDRSRSEQLTTDNWRPTTDN